MTTPAPDREQWLMQPRWLPTLRADPPDGPWRLEAVLRDGQVVTLLGVPPAELERLRGWHVAG